MKVVTIILIFVVILSTCGCIDTSNIGMGFNPQTRLDRDPNLVAACQYEQWLNTSFQTTETTSNSVISVTKTDVNWVCYYRDNHTSVQKIGSFKNTYDASTYIWYYYEHGQMPIIKVVE